LNKHTICEFGEIRLNTDFGEKVGTDYSNNVLYLGKKPFRNLERFVLENQDPRNDKEPPLALYTRQRKKRIKVKNYVGVLETRDGSVIEILPKIYSPIHMSVREVKKLFLRMLRCLSDPQYRILGTANLEANESLPLLDVFIAEYVRECKELIRKGLRADYTSAEENLSTVRGRILFSEQIRKNLAYKSRIFCKYSEHCRNTPRNRIIKSTLEYLKSRSKNRKNLGALNALLASMEDVAFSSDVEGDLRKCRVTSRLHSDYDNIIRVSEVFLTGRSLTCFSGDTMSAALLFPMEKVFEDYVARQFKRHTDGYVVKTQRKGYFLVDYHNGSPMFGLRPDITMDRDNGGYHRIIIDTKWKIVDESKKSSNYKISQDDMYQMFAYGKKCSYKPESDPILVLLYPRSESLNDKLPEFEYERKKLILYVQPFDLCENDTEQVVANIMRSVTDNIRSDKTGTSG